MDVMSLLDRRLPEPLTKTERRLLTDMLRSEPMLKALRNIREELEGSQRGILACNLADMQGVHTAVKLQGRVQGMGRVFDALGEQAAEPAEEAAAAAEGE